jgi:hypothetical protein
MANAWREHVKKTMTEMKAKGGKVMLKDVLKAAAKTYKKSGQSASAGKTRKRKTAKTAKRGKKGGRKGKKGKSGKKR